MPLRANERKVTLNGTKHGDKLDNNWTDGRTGGWRGDGHLRWRRVARSDTRQLDALSLLETHAGFQLRRDDRRRMYCRPPRDINITTITDQKICPGNKKQFDHQYANI